MLCLFYVPILRSFVDHIWCVTQKQKSGGLQRKKARLITILGTLPILRTLLRSSNPANWAVDVLFQHGIESVIVGPNGDVAIWPLNTNPNPRIIAFLLEHPKYIRIAAFNRNPGAIDYLKVHPNEIHKEIFANPAIFELTGDPCLIEVLLKLYW